MSVSAFLYPILEAGATLLAKSAVGEFAKGAGKKAFEALTARLKDKHDIKSVALLEDAASEPTYADKIKKDLDRADLSGDPRIKALADALIEAMEALPTADRPAIDVGVIRARGNQVFRDVDGIRAERIEADGDQTFEGIKQGK